MGYPLFNNYTLFRALAKPRTIEENTVTHEFDKLKWEREHMYRAVNQFSLFAFILHDPESHPEFDQYLNRVFEELDRTTRDKLIFFALVNPDKKWLENRRNRTFHKALNRFEYYAGEIHCNLLPDSDPAASAYALAWALNIPSDDLPVILITDDLRSSNFLHVSTSVNDVKVQLEELGKYAQTYRRRSGEYNFDLRRIQGFENATSNEYTFRLPRTKESFAETLSNIMSFISLSKNRDELHDEFTLQQIESVIKELQEKLRRSQNAPEKFDSEVSEFDYYAIYLANLISFLPRRRRADFELGINLDYLEPESCRMLKTAMKVKEFLDDPNQYMPQMRFEEFDFSPSAICFAKFFEREVNLSFVHWIRRYLGVRLPRYFDRVDPDKRALYTPENILFREPTPIDFNAGNYHSWRPPSLGQSQLSLTSLSQKEVFITNFHYVSQENVVRLLELWHDFKNIRNNAAHPRMINRRELDRMVRILTKMNDMHIFSAMKDMKKYFSGR